MTDDELETDVRRTLHAKADALEVEDRAFDPDLGSVVELDEIPRRRSRTVWTALVAAAVIIAVIAVAVAVRSPGSKPADVGETPSTIPVTTTTFGMVSQSQPAPAALVQQVTSVPADILGSDGVVRTADVAPLTLPGPALRGADGKIRIVWIGAEYCPYCAAERWPLIVALSRFGTFSNLRVTGSAVTTTVGSPEVFPNTQGFSFHGATYESQYFEFAAAETEDNRYKPLDELTTEQSALFDKYDAPPYLKESSQGSIPFIDMGNLWLISGASYDASILAGKTAQQIADALRDPTSNIAQQVDGVANVMTNLLCPLLNGQQNQIPVCSDPRITRLGPTGLVG